LKEGTGALREIHTALWVAGAVHPTDNPVLDLEWRGVVTGDDVQRARAANEFFLKLRLWLHLATQKKTDVLSVELQDRCSRELGYTGVGARPAQDLLRDYYRHAENALRFSEKVMRRLLEGPLRLDDHFIATQQRLKAAHPYTLRNHPELLLTPFVLSHKYHFPMAADLDLMIEEALPLVNSSVRRNGIMRASFLALLNDVGEAATALAELRGRGVLQKFLPEFDAMLHLAPADPMHELTVGEHSIQAVRQLGEMWRQRNEDEALYAVWEGVDDAELLILATLLHDVGKIEDGSDHAVSGARLVGEIGQRLDMHTDRIERMQLLVRRHLLLPRVARLRDLSSPGTIRDVMENVRNVPTLKCCICCRWPIRALSANALTRLPSCAPCASYTNEYSLP
jgi:[protein-PII] uridylyltransferase